MTEYDIIQAISINLLRIGEWYYKDPKKNAPICERYLAQSKQLSEQVSSAQAKPYLTQLRALHLSLPEPHEKTAERFLTLGVMLQHPHKWMQKT